METFASLRERKVYGNWDVQKIRHYTTFKGLQGIVRNKKIKAKVSKGDEDWGIAMNSVSVLEDEGDCEIENVLHYNSKGIPLGVSFVLGLHMDKICVMVEVDAESESLEGLTFIENLRKDAKNFCQNWNRKADWVIGLKRAYEVGEKVIEELKTNLSRPKEERMQIYEKYGVLPRMFERNFGYDDWKGVWHEETWTAGKKLDEMKEWLAHPDDNAKILISEHNFHRLSDEDLAGFEKAIDDGDFTAAFRYWKKCGFTEEQTRDPYGKVTRYDWMFDLNPEITALANAFVSKSRVESELRVPHDVVLTPDNCTIYIFKGLLKACMEAEIKRSFAKYIRDGKRASEEVPKLYEEALTKIRNSGFKIVEVEPGQTI